MPVLFQNPTIIFNFTLMDNITFQLQALSCLLPLLALMFLAVQFCRVSAFKSDLPLAYTIEDKYSSSYEGLILINNQFKHQINNHQSPSFDFIKSLKPDTSTKDHRDQHQDHFKRERMLDSSHNYLQGCSIGLSKMNRINKAYFRRCHEGINNNFSKKNKMTKYLKRKTSFEPTHLSIIVEGLQY